MIENHYNTTFTTKRLTDVEGTNKREYTDNLSSTACMIQPLDPSFTGDLPGSFGKEWLMFCPVVDLEEGDRVISGGKEYKVTGIETLEWQGEDHMEATLRIFES